MKLCIAVAFLTLLYLHFDAVSGIRISKKKCDDYRDDYRQKFQVETFDENAEEAVLKEFPFMAIIQNGSHSYNGILISDRFVLSVAHLDHKGKKYVVLSDLDINTHDDDAFAQSFEVIYEIKHPKYSSDITFDLKLLQLNESVTFNEYIQPACLPQFESKISNQLLEIGWTTTNIRSNYRLHKVKTSTILNAVCKEKFKFIAHQKEHMAKIDNGNIFCTMTNDGDRDMCYGYFSAALLNNNRNMYTSTEVLGLMSTNTGCNDTYPSVFVRLTTSLDWIESVVWPNEIVPNITSNEIEKTTETSKNIATKTAEPTTTHKVEIPTASSTTINEPKKTAEPTTATKLDVTTASSTTINEPKKTAEPIETRKAVITTESSTSSTATTRLPPKVGLKSLDLHYIIIIVAVILLILCVTVACLCFQVNRSRKRESIALSVECHM